MKAFIQAMQPRHSPCYKAYYWIGRLRCLKVALVNRYCIGAGSAFLWGADYRLVNASSVF